MDEQSLVEKLHRIEALHAGATTPGERVAAEKAMERIVARLGRIEREEPAVEYRFSLHDPWKRRLFLALLRRYGLRPYRYPRQRRSTIMVRVPRSFLDQTLWPEFQDLSALLGRYLDEVTSRVIREALRADVSDPGQPPPGGLA